MLYKKDQCYLPPFVVNEVNPILPLSQTVDWGLKMLKIEDIHAKGITGKGIKVAVLDTAIGTHPDLDGQIIKRINTYDESQEPYEMKHGHGLTVASVIAAKNNTTGVLGIAPDVKIVGIKVLRESGSGSYGNIISGVYYAISEGVDIINMSLGGASANTNLQKAIQEAVSKGIIVICAAGNDGQDNSVNYPGRYPETFCVGAVNKQGKVSSFSSRGWEVDIAAPGEQILCAYKNNGYARVSGTSYACPASAACAALFLQAKRDFTHEVIKQTAIDIEEPGLDPKSGHGLINPSVILDTINPTPSKTPTNTVTPTPTKTSSPTPPPSASPLPEIDFSNAKKAYELLGKFLVEQGVL